jgi:hypothetical protein
MNKVFVLPANEDWCIDQFVNDWNRYNSDVSVTDYNRADVIWLLADFAWTHVPIKLLREKKVITTVHHVVPQKFDKNAEFEFNMRDSITSVYHVYNDRAYQFVKQHSNKRIVLINYWANNNIWRVTGQQNEFRKKFSIPEDAYVVGSFQRDTEGAGISRGVFLPKLEKGPDILCDYLAQSQTKKLHVLLAGWRRQYVESRLLSSGINYTYFERPDQPTLNELYQCCDIYPIPARFEGGPQALIECGLTGVPVISRPVGIAEQLLPSSAINSELSLATPVVPNIPADWRIPTGFEKYRKLISEL